MTNIKLCTQNIVVFVVLNFVKFFIPSSGGMISSLISLLLSVLAFFALAVFADRKAFFGMKLFENKQQVKSVFFNFAVFVIVTIVLGFILKILGIFFFNLSVVMEAVFLLVFWILSVVVISIRNKYTVVNKSALFVTLAVSVVASLAYLFVSTFLLYGTSFVSFENADIFQYMNLIKIARYLSISDLVADTIIGSMAIIYFSLCDKKEI